MTQSSPNPAAPAEARKLLRQLLQAVESRVRFDQHLGVPGYPAAVRPDDPAAALARIRAELGECTRCRLAQSRTRIVFGSGNPCARLMFVGEGPGEDEDREGLPFVGRAGKLLTNIIENGMKLKRADCYIANVVKSRPPQNRAPSPEEIAACFPFLEAQIRAIRPEAIVALGAVAAHTLLQTDAPISRLRGQWTKWQGIPVMPTFHPSYLLRNESAKRLVWEDIQKVMARLAGRAGAREVKSK
jgi:DNA polymerase